jgi:hypothetical protein
MKTIIEGSGLAHSKEKGKVQPTRIPLEEDPFSQPKAK